MKSQKVASDLQSQPGGVRSHSEPGAKTIQTTLPLHARCRFSPQPNQRKSILCSFRTSDSPGSSPGGGAAPIRLYLGRSALRSGPGSTPTRTASPTARRRFQRPCGTSPYLYLFRLPDVWRRGYAADCRIIKAYAAKKCHGWTDRPGVIGSGGIARRRSIPKGICPGLNMEFRGVFDAIPRSSVVADRYEARAFPGGASVRRVLRSAAARRRASGAASRHRGCFRSGPLDASPPTAWSLCSIRTWERSTS